MNSDPDLYALVLRLRPLPGRAPRPQGHGAHALFLDLVRQVDPELAVRLHTDAPSKPFTVALLPQSGGPARGDALVELRVTLLRAELFAPFTRALLQQTAAAPLRLGEAALALADVFGTPGHHPWASYGSFAALYAAACPTSPCSIQFASATAFGQGTRPDGRPRLGLLPLPETVFKSIALRWNELAPPELGVKLEEVEAAARETLVCHHELRSCSINLGKGPQKGFVGACSYELPADPAQAQRIALLADAAFYLGVGMKTARGMGLCRRLNDER